MYSKRIIVLSNLCSGNYDMADIGADHGFLSILLAKKYANKNILAIENKKGPYENLLNNIINEGLNNNSNLKISLSDGLDKVSDNYKCIILAGMGFLNIKNIIFKNIKKISFIDEFIVDCHTNFFELIEFMKELNYGIFKIQILEESNIIYFLIKFKKNCSNNNFFEEINDDDLKSLLKKYNNLSNVIKEVKNYTSFNNSLLEYLYIKKVNNL